MKHALLVIGFLCSSLASATSPREEMLSIYAAKVVSGTVRTSPRPQGPDEKNLIQQGEDYRLPGGNTIRLAGVEYVINSFSVHANGQRLRIPTCDSSSIVETGDLVDGYKFELVNYNGALALQTTTSTIAKDIAVSTYKITESDFGVEICLKSMLLSKDNGYSWFRIDTK